MLEFHNGRLTAQKHNYKKEDETLHCPTTQSIAAALSCTYMQNGCMRRRVRKRKTFLDKIIKEGVRTAYMSKVSTINFKRGPHKLSRPIQKGNFTRREINIAIFSSHESAA